MPDESLRVLIVDDEHGVADTLALIVSRSGYRSLAVYSGEEAIEAAKSFQPHAVLSDIMLPGINGVELARHLAQNCAGCRVLLMTGHDSAMGIIEEPWHVLTKPVPPKTILAFIAACAQS